ncbi:RNA polymerase sigma factor [Geodermatophilus sp. CPCC 206100]|uniref:RNA polymerase sigma factor n=1 Tax=Geodermatophilus sp. CPCC 206100 TaxID=3020054 RepID=UPI003B000E7E
MVSSQPESTRYRGPLTSAPESTGRTPEPTSRPRQPRPASGPANPGGQRTTRGTAAARADRVPAAGDSTGHLVRRAAQGDQRAWHAVVERYSGLLQSVVGEFRLTEAQAADAVQTTWLRLLEDPAPLRRPERLAGWLRATARRTCREAVRGAGRERPWAQTDGGPSPSDTDPVAHVLRQERVGAVRRAVQELPEPHQQLLELLVASPALSAAQIGARLGMPVENVEPTRARVLAGLRTALAPAGLQDLAL